MTRRSLLAAAGTIVALALSVVLYMLNTYVPLPLDADWEPLPEAVGDDAAVTVRFSGTATLLVSDGSTAWMVDGWFTRPGPLRLAFGKIAPDAEAISYGLAANAVQSLAAVIPVHSHYDHAMDAPEVARRTGAILMGSESTANIGRGWGLPESQIQVLVSGQAQAIGQFRVTAFESSHFQFADPALRERALGNPHIRAPLVPPVSAFDYRLGKAYVLHVQHPAGNFLIVGSAGYREGALKGLQADTVFLGIGGLGSQTEGYRRAYWRETVAAVGARRVIPIHFDSLTAPLDAPLRGPLRAMAFLSGDAGQTLAFLQAKEQGDGAVRFRLLPRYTPVRLYP